MPEITLLSALHTTFPSNPHLLHYHDTLPTHPTPLFQPQNTSLELDTISKDLYPEFDDNRNHPLVLSTIRGSKKIRADPVTRKLPLRQIHLASFVSHSTSTGSYDDLLFATIMSCAFYGCHRMGELIAKSDKSLFDSGKIIKRSSLKFTHNHAQYRLPYHKANLSYCGSDVVFSQHDIASPVHLLQSYTSLRDARHGPCLSLFLCEDGSIPNRSWFDNEFFKFLSHDFGGHSARAGGATYYASLGFSASIIQALGHSTYATTLQSGLNSNLPPSVYINTTIN